MWAVLSSLISLFFAMAASTDSPLSDCPANEISNINEQSSQVNIDTIMYPCALFILVHPGAFWCILVHSGASWCILVHPGASWRIQVHHSASCCILVRIISEEPINSSQGEGEGLLDRIMFGPFTVCACACSSGNSVCFGLSLPSLRRLSIYWHPQGWMGCREQQERIQDQKRENCMNCLTQIL